MRNPLIAALCLTCLALPATAQTWTPRISANASLLFGSVYPPAPSMGFSCTAPAPENAPLIETGSHESHISGPFEVIVGFYDPLFDWQPDYVVDTITVTVDDTSYRMPPLELNELQGSAIYLPMTDPFILSLFGAESLILDTGQGTAYAYPTDGLADGLRAALGHCNDRWVVLGNTLPAGLAAVMEGSPPPEPQASELPQQILDQAAQSCNAAGLAELPDSALQRADLDGDGLTDYLLHHGALSCVQGMSLYCGAANCSIDAFLSTQGYAVREAFLGTGAGLVEMPDGRIGVQISGTFSLCGETGLCPGPQVWDGTAFRLVN